MASAEVKLSLSPGQFDVIREALATAQAYHQTAYDQLPEARSGPQRSTEMEQKREHRASVVEISTVREILGRG